MAIIGQSKNNGLFEKVTTEGTRFRELDYRDVSATEPLISGYHKGLDPGITPGIPKVTEEAGGVGIISDVQRQVTTRIDDTARILKLLTTRQGIKWEAHNAELAAIQNNLESKRSQYAGTGSTVLETIGQILSSTGRSLVGGLIDTARVTAETIAQTAVAGTGEHFSAWYERSYLGKNAAADALAGGHVIFNPVDPVTYHQLPTSEVLEDNTGLAASRLSLATLAKNGHADPNNISTERKVTYTTPEGRIFSASLVSDFFSDKTYETELQPLDQNSQLYYRAQGNGNLEGDSITGTPLEEAQKPKRGENYHSNAGLVGETSEMGDQGQVSWSLDNQSGSYLEKPEFQPGNRYAVTKYAKAESSSLSPNEPESKGPWMSDGAQSLWADRSNSSEPGSSDGGANKSDQNTFRDRWTRGDASTRVDNGRIEMIPFYIRAICPEGTSPYGSGRVPSGKNGYLFFEANLDSFSDNYEANWQSTDYIGRADKFWNYNGFDRQISFSFKMVAHSKSHLKPIYNRLNGLLSMTTPTYGTQADGGSFMRGTLAEISIGDLLSQQLGFIRSVGLKWETDYMWETDTATIMVPHVLDVSINFTPIHRFVPHTDLRYFQLVDDPNPGVDTFIVDHKVLYRK